MPVSISEICFLITSQMWRSIEVASLRAHSHLSFAKLCKSLSTPDLLLCVASICVAFSNACPCCIILSLRFCKSCKWNDFCFFFINDARDSAPTLQLISQEMIYSPQLAHHLNHFCTYLHWLSLCLWSKHTSLTYARKINLIGCTKKHAEDQDHDLTNFGRIQNFNYLHKLLSHMILLHLFDHFSPNLQYCSSFEISLNLIFSSHFSGVWCCRIKIRHQFMWETFHFSKIRVQFRMHLRCGDELNIIPIDCKQLPNSWGSPFAVPIFKSYPSLWNIFSPWECSPHLIFVN